MCLRSTKLKGAIGRKSYSRDNSVILPKEVVSLGKVATSMLALGIHGHAGGPNGWFVRPLKLDVS